MSTYRILGIVLLLQCALAGLTWWPSSDSNVTARLLIDVAELSLTGLEISSPEKPDADSEKIALTQNDGQWVIASEENYPADPNKVSEVLRHLLNATVRSPIAATQTSHDALVVSDSNHDKKVMIKTTDQEWVFYIGASSGRAVNIRKGDEKEVYVLQGFSHWAIGTTSASFYDSMYVDEDTENIQSFELIRPDGGFALSQKTHGEWVVAHNGNTLPADTEGVHKLLTAALSLRVADLMTPSDKVSINSGVSVAFSKQIDGATAKESYLIGQEINGRTAVKSTQPSLPAVWVNTTALASVLSASGEALLRDNAE